MEADARKDRNPEVNAKARKYGRIRIAGWLMLCAWPVILMSLVYYYRTPTIAEGEIALAALLSIIWIGLGIAVLIMGHNGLKEAMKQEHTE